MKSSEVSIKTRSTPAFLTIQGQVTKDTTVKWSIGEKLVGKQEFNNPMDKFAVEVTKSNKTVGHLPCEFSRVPWYFLACGGEISLHVISHQWQVAMQRNGNSMSAGV